MLGFKAKQPNLELDSLSDGQPVERACDFSSTDSPGSIDYSSGK